MVAIGIYMADDYLAAQSPYGRDVAGPCQARTEIRRSHSGLGTGHHQSFSYLNLLCLRCACPGRLNYVIHDKDLVNLVSRFSEVSYSKQFELALMSVARTIQDEKRSAVHAVVQCLAIAPSPQTQLHQSLRHTSDRDHGAPSD